MRKHTDVIESGLCHCMQVVSLEPVSLNGRAGVAQEYYSSILKKLKQVGASSRQSDFYV